MKPSTFVVFVIVASSSYTQAIQTGVLRARREAASDADSARNVQGVESKPNTKSYVRLGRTGGFTKEDELENKSKVSGLQSIGNDVQATEEELIDADQVNVRHEYDPEIEFDVDEDDYQALTGLEKRPAGDRNFVRMGRSNALGEIYSDGQSEKRDSKSFVRMGKDGKSFVRMGKDGKSFVRMGRDGRSFVRMGKDGKSFVRMGKDGKSFVRMGKAVDFQNTYSDAVMGDSVDLQDEAKRGDKSFVRMGKSADTVEIKRGDKSFVRMGKSIVSEDFDKRGDKSFVRMGKSNEFLDSDKREAKTYVRLGRNFNSDLDKRASSKQYVRFGRNSNENLDQLEILGQPDEIDFDNYDKKEISKKAKQYVRFG